jgi:hypothetical protein
MAPVFILFNGSPFILFWTATTVSVIGLILNYLVVQKIVDEKVALLSTLIQSLSPLLVWQTQLSKLHVFFWILMPIFMYLLFLIWNGKKKAVFFAGLTFGIMFSFHFSQIPLIGVVILLFLIKKNIYKFKDWLKFGLGLLIPNLTLLWQDRNLVLWLPYRAINIADKDPAGTLASLIEYFGRNIFWNQRIWFIGLAVFTIVFGHYVYTNRKKVITDFVPFYIISSVGLMFGANILHGASPIHYFLPIFTTVPILFGIYLSKFKYWYLVIAVFMLLNFDGYLKPEFGNDYIPYTKQIAMADFIVRDTKGLPFSVKRIGPYDYFPENYSQNYKYLLLWHGAKLTESSTNTYIINDANGTITK